MGRPLNKKFFGNRNVGTAVTTDNGIGGNQVASVTLGTLGSYTTRPTMTFSAPDKAGLGGVTALGTVTSEALSAVVTTGGTGYVVGDLLTLTAADGGSAIAYVATVSTGAVATVNFTGTGASRGSFQALPGAKFATGATAPNTVGGTGTGAEITVTFRAKAVVVTNAGSGYTDPADATPAFTQSVTGTTVLGTTATANNNENAITMTARLTGGTAVPVDIIKQVSTKRFKVTDGTRTGTVELKASVATTAGEGSIRLVDSDGGTYFATKLTAHRATITRGTGVQAAFVTGTAVAWNMTAATASSLLIDNA
jgi:hypothetical protein